MKLEINFVGGKNIKKTILITLLVIIILAEALVTGFYFLFFRYFTTPTDFTDMVEYSTEDVLNVASKKYNVTEWIYKDLAICGTADYDKNGVFEIELLDDRFSGDFSSGDNLEKSFTAFAGKNGNHDIQIQYRYFLCYVALGKCADGSYKFVYYNTNINKNAQISDTIGASNYNLEVLPTEITDSLFEVNSNSIEMKSFLYRFKNKQPTDYYYSSDRLTIKDYSLNKNDNLLVVEFYKENGNVVYDVYFVRDYHEPSIRELVYSSSKQYDVIYYYQGIDKTLYFDVTQNIYPYEDTDLVTLQGSAIPKIDGEVIYSRITCYVEYQTYSDSNGKVLVSTEKTTQEGTSFGYTYRLKKEDGIDYNNTAKFILSDYYVLYKKPTESK